MSRARSFSARTVLVRPERGRRTPELERVLVAEAGIELLEGVGVLVDAAGFADDSTAVTSHLVAGIAGHPGATLALSVDRESGFVYLRLCAAPELIARAEPALAELAALVSSAGQGVRVSVRRR